MSSLPVAAPSPDDGVRHYTLCCLASLGMMALALFLRGLDALSLLPGLVGALAVVFRWRRWGALGVLAVVAWLLAAQRWPVLHPAFVVQEITWMLQPTGFGPPRRLYLRPALLGATTGFQVVDVLLCAATLAYFAGHYRLLSVTRRIFPGDPRRRSIHDPPEERRSPRLVAGREILTLLAPLPLWIGLAWVCWRWLERKETELDIDDRWWQVMLLAWLLGLLFLVAAASVRYATQGRMRPDEAALLLQDTLWRETSREQRRINRWVAWARRRQRRKVEP